MHHALRLKACVLLVNLAEKLLDANILSLLRARLNLGLVRLEVDLQHLIRHGELPSFLITILLLLLLMVMLTLSFLVCWDGGIVE